MIPAERSREFGMTLTGNTTQLRVKFTGTKKGVRHRLARPRVDHPRGRRHPLTLATSPNGMIKVQAESISSAQNVIYRVREERDHVARYSSPVIHMRCMTIANFRAHPMIALFRPRRAATRNPHS